MANVDLQNPIDLFKINNTQKRKDLKIVESDRGLTTMNDGCLSMYVIFSTI
jgi:hypothetical protein